MAAYYNEFEPYAAEWLRNLIAAGHIPAGDVDTRSIVDVNASDLIGYTQCHFFAGIGGWPLAARLAGWPDERELWTGSCPCQPFSVAGKQRGTDDERHLWPEFARLIRECRPATIFGEQVASPAGRGWLAGVRADLEAMGYASGGGDLCAAGVGAPHIRQRLYWLADAVHAGRPERWAGARQGSVAGRGGVDGLDDAERARLEGHAGNGDDGHQPGWIDAQPIGSTAEAGRAGAWREFDVAWLTDGTARRIEPGSFPLAHGVPARVGKLRAYGNAIVPQVAAEVIGAYMECAP